MMQQGGAATYAWTWNDKLKKLCCQKSPAGTCRVRKFWEVEELTAFHDAQLAQATAEINGILGAIEARNNDPKRHLSLILFQNRHFLVWAEDRVGAYDDDETIRKTLRLKS